MARTPARVLLVGINAYPQAPLRGCVNDVTDLDAFLRLACDVLPQEIQLVRDGDATTANLREALTWFSDPSIAGTRRLHLFSGHGTRFDRSGETQDAICPVDFDWSADRVLTARDLHDVFARIPADGCAQWISDSCHSGELLRDLPRLSANAKTYPGQGEGFGPVRTFGAALVNLPHVALLSGCRSDQTSADAAFGGRANGALVYHLIKALQHPDGLSISMRELAARVRLLLAANGYAQIPQCYGNDTQADRPFMDQSQGVCMAGGG